MISESTLKTLSALQLVAGKEEWASQNLTISGNFSLFSFKNFIGSVALNTRGVMAINCLISEPEPQEAG